MKMLGMVEHPCHTLHSGQLYLLLLHNRLLLEIVLIEDNGWTLGGVGNVVNDCPASINMLVRLQGRRGREDFFF